MVRFFISWPHSCVSNSFVVHLHDQDPIVGLGTDVEKDRYDNRFPRVADVNGEYRLSARKEGYVSGNCQAIRASGVSEGQIGDDFGFAELKMSTTSSS